MGCSTAGVEVLSEEAVGSRHPRQSGSWILAISHGPRSAVGATRPRRRSGTTQRRCRRKERLSTAVGEGAAGPGTATRLETPAGPWTLPSLDPATSAIEKHKTGRSRQGGQEASCCRKREGDEACAAKWMGIRSCRIPRRGSGRKLMRRENSRGGRCGDGEGNQERQRMGLRRATVDWWRGRAVRRVAGCALAATAGWRVRAGPPIGACRAASVRGALQQSRAAAREEAVVAGLDLPLVWWENGRSTSLEEGSTLGRAAGGGGTPSGSEGARPPACARGQWREKR
jgi:hypothetical protein